MKSITLLFGVILTCILISLFLIRIIFNYIYNIKFDWGNFIDTLIGNIIGIILPLLIFNLFYEYFTRIYTSNDISEKITETIMAKKEVIDSFEYTTKKQFIKTTLQSILQLEKGDVVYELISPYLQSKLNLRKHYKYTIVLEEMNSNDICKWDNYISSSNYYLIRENLSYTKIYTDELHQLPEILNIGFFVDDNVLDTFFQNTNFVFRESLAISNEDFEKIKANKEMAINECMNVKLFINEVQQPISLIDINDFGIIISFKIIPGILMNEIKYDISFSMPQIKEKNNFLAVLCEPTYRPNIRFIYPREDFKIFTTSFFDENYEDKIGINDIEGIKEVELSNWVLPRSGVVFIWNKK